MCKEKGNACYANHVEEVAGKKEIMNVFEYEYETQEKDGKIHKVHFCRVSNIELKKEI